MENIKKFSGTAAKVRCSDYKLHAQNPPSAMKIRWSNVFEVAYSTTFAYIKMNNSKIKARDGRNEKHEWKLNSRKFTHSAFA